MQFVVNGPEIPDTLLQVHEEGRVVFFCGAGISYPAGLPGFSGLVDDIYRLLGTGLSPIEKNAYNQHQYDTTLDLLEHRYPGGRLAVRTALKQALQPKLQLEGAINTHSALLCLGRTREGMLRLVTTNFDRIFEDVAKLTEQTINGHSAPMLPIPKNSRWNGLVYLHGLLPDGDDESALHRLVFTSGDFGLAYLTERWASRFVSELFRSYIVCFVGYSINDPVLRYMMDALAADRMLGENTPQAYAFVDCEPGQEDAQKDEWKAKGVTSILYEVPPDSNDHSALHRTLKIWADTYRDGVLGKERIVEQYASARPSASTQQDNFVGRMLWALSHKSGLPAKRFAKLNPVPSLDWLEVFSEDRYDHCDLERFDVPSRPDVDEKLRFSLIRRPASYNRAPWMSLVYGVVPCSELDPVAIHLASWLVRHLNDPALIIWLTQRGGQLHERLRQMIEDKLNRFARLEQEGKDTEIADIRANAPNAIPNKIMHKLWRLLLTGRVKSPFHDLDFYRWMGRLSRYGLTATLRLELRELLSPKIFLRKSFHWGEGDEEADAAELVNLKQLVDWELVLTSDHVHSSLKHLTGTERWCNALPYLHGDFQQLLLDALDLFRELGAANEHEDRSYWDMPSISQHPQNRNFHDWTTLIELVRDAWLVVRENESARATQIALGWFKMPYPTFKRLALFAASYDGCVPGDRWVNWFLADNAWWLWSSSTLRETMRLLVLQGAKLLPKTMEKLVATILGGPPREMYRDGIEPEQWKSLVDHSVWLHLAKIKDGGGQLGQPGEQRFQDLSEAHPKWRVADDEHDEFSFWIGVTRGQDDEGDVERDIAPLKREDLVIWLKKPASGGLPFRDDWREICRTHFPRSFTALCVLARGGDWPAERWREALQAWSEEGRALRSWRYAASLIQTMPADVLKDVAHAFAWWLEAVSKEIDRDEDVFLDLCRRVLTLPLPDGVYTEEPVLRAINHPIGQVTRALLNVWLKREPNDNQTLPDDFKCLFTAICDTGVEQFRHGRVLLASHLIALFRVDMDWTQTYLLPLFNWKHQIEAEGAWTGFLWSPRVYWPLLIAIKPHLLDTVHHYESLGEFGGQFAAFLTYAALDPSKGFSSQEFQLAFGDLPQAGLDEVADTLSRALESVDQREIYWKNRIHPFWHEVWPKSSDLASDGIAESLAQLSIAARDEFPAALSEVQDWLRPVEYPEHIVYYLHESALAERFPEYALRLLNSVIYDQPLVPSELAHCLAAIVEAAPDLEHDSRYQRLIEYSRRHGI